MAYPEDLLEQARHLARRERRRPKQASLRRAVSTAYYALFQLLIAEAARNWRRAAQRHSLGRLFDHGPMRKACEKKRSEINLYFKKKPNPCPQLTLARHLHTVTGTFIQLQQERHAADYDSSRRWSREEVFFHITAVEAAFQSWRNVRDEDAAQDFLLSLLLKDR